MINRLKKYIVFYLVLILGLFSVGCGSSEKKKTIEGTYSLFSAENDGKNVLSDFQLYTIEFKKDGSMIVKISYFGILETRQSTYEYSSSQIKEKYKQKTYLYIVSENSLSTDMTDGEETIHILLKKENSENILQAVDFEGILFGEDISNSKFYNYCPAIIDEMENGREVMHVWYCTNLDDGVIVDYIGYRKGVKQDDGKWLFSEQSIALAPTPDTWDARHTCDPAVIKGEFHYNGETYSYLMAYLGCTTEDYNRNETGLAVSKSAEGPFIKIDELNPIVPWYDNESTTVNPEQWGTGMPTLMSIDQKGEVLLTYQSSTRGTTGIQRWDFSDLNQPHKKFTSSMAQTGIVNSVGGKCNVGIVDFSYDPVKGRFYVFGVTNEKNPPDITKTLVNSHCVLAYIDGITDMEKACTLLENGIYTWNIVGYVGPNITGYERNHNPGIVRNSYGYIPDSEKIGVVVSTGHNSWENENIFTYRLLGAYFDLTTKDI